MKTCLDCGKEQPLSEFYRHIRMEDGHLNKCKSCVRMRVRKRRRANESVREYDRQRAKTPERKTLSRRVVKAWREKNEGAYKAQSAVSNALRDGLLKKEPCLFCSSTKHLHAHHRDYSEPLDVTWVCAKCHHRLHALEKAA